MTNAAIAAKEIRARLKQAGITAQVTCKNYSGGNSVQVNLVDATPETCKQAQDIAYPFQYGHFDGMADSYDYSNRRQDLPAQARFVFVSNHMSDATAEKVWAFVRSEFADAQGAPESLKDAGSFRIGNEWAPQFVWRQFCQADSVYWQHQQSCKG